MPSYCKYSRAKDLQASARGRMMANARWKKHAEESAKTLPPVSDANRVFDFLQARRGKIAFTHDLADHSTREVVTWVQRFSVKGRCDQFDLYRNGAFVLTGGQKKCTRAMTPEYFPILRYD